jgi:2-keto-4-pentenoate hydratase/2-oxohepta-3-ene-1,7-dioic acid hydratase in catechol pathway
MKIICVGRNFSAHAKEMNADIPSVPMLFLKPDTALLREPDFYYPSFSNNIHFECELVIKIDKVGKHIDEKFAHKYYSSVSLGIDFTARDLQDECKQKGSPWEISKAFDHSAVLSNQWLSLEEHPWEALTFEFFQNKEKRQVGLTKEMIFNVDQIIAYASKFFTLKTGDLIFTGTPAGVAPIQIGDTLVGTLNGLTMFEVNIK